MRLLLPVLALSLAACGGPDRPPEAAFADFEAAAQARDGEAAYAHLDAAADGGHLGALRTLIDAHERGYVRVPGAPADARHLRVPTPMWRIGGLRERYARALRDSVEAGHPAALLRAAQDLTGNLITRDGETVSEIAPADRDSVEALYRRLVPTAVPRLPLAVLAWHLGLEDERAARLDEAVAAAEPNACALRLSLTDGFAMDAAAAGFAAYVDRAEACPTPRGAEPLAARDLRAIAAQRDLGNAASVALLDSLDALGVFERHPHLAAVAGIR